MEEYCSKCICYFIQKPYLTPSDTTILLKCHHSLLNSEHRNLFSEADLISFKSQLMEMIIQAIHQLNRFHPSDINVFIAENIELDSFYNNITELNVYYTNILNYIENNPNILNANQSLCVIGSCVKFLEINEEIYIGAKRVITRILMELTR